ncbi:FAD-dependent monooxygenase [Streptacidiphilus sp. EB129]|uniref:FAD-dependent monooxygenase n=1 Tax=Streptacidiphilus sp. EB129 TaxID=3156262 RepID=UPI003516B4E9
MAQRTLRAAVVGAGIGGLATAMALTRAGLRVDVYEQAGQLREVGAGLHLAPNGSRLLERFGLMERLRKVAVRPEALEVRLWNAGKVLARQPMGDVWEAEFGGSHYTVHRADLHTALLEQVPSESLRLGRRCVGFAEDADGVDLHFADGSVARADVLIGADGVHSLVRRAVAGPDLPVLTGSSAVRGLVPVERLTGADGLPALPADTMFVWTGPQARFLAAPVSGGQLLSFVAVVPDGGAAEESWSRSSDVGVLAEAFQDWDPIVRQIIGLAEEVGHWSLRDREPLPRWSTARTTLLGDAAHPMLPYHGQGASQAIEDAVVLARCLAESAGQPAAALRRYERARREHSARVQLGTRDSGSQRLASGRNDSAERSGRELSALVEDTTWIQRHDAEAALAGLPAA